MKDVNVMLGNIQNLEKKVYVRLEKLDVEQDIIKGDLKNDLIRLDDKINGIGYYSVISYFCKEKLIRSIEGGVKRDKRRIKSI
jgi:hypothetical protein